MKKSWRQYRIWDVKTDRYFYMDRTSEERIENQIRNRAEVAPEDRHKLTPQTYYEKVTVTLRKPMDCIACGKSSKCAKPLGPGVRHSEVWVCDRCFKTEMRARRDHNTRGKLSRGNPDYLVIRSRPKKDEIIEIWRYTP